VGKNIVYVIAGIIVGILVALLPLALYSGIFFLTQGHVTGTYGTFEAFEPETPREAEGGSELKTIVSLCIFSEICILIIPALIIGFIAYQLFTKKTGKLYKI